MRFDFPLEKLYYDNSDRGYYDVPEFSSYRHEDFFNDGKHYDGPQVRKYNMSKIIIHYNVKTGQMVGFYYFDCRDKHEWSCLY